MAQVFSLIFITHNLAYALKVKWNRMVLFQMFFNKRTCILRNMYKNKFLCCRNNLSNKLLLT